MPAKKKTDNPRVDIIKVVRGRATFCLLGSTPLMHNCMSNKAMQELLYPKGRKTAVEKKTTMKHNPIEEFEDSFYYARDNDAPTYVQHLSSAFRQAMQSAAKDLPGTNGAEIGRLTRVENERIAIFGKPLLDMRPVRMADIKRTPDIRSRLIQPRWAAQVTVSYMQPQLDNGSIGNLLAAAGAYIGIGDGRNEKGNLDYGLWEIVSPDDEEYLDIVKNWGRKPQMEAARAPEFYNEETERLFTWFYEEVKRRKHLAPLQPTTQKRARKKANGVAAETVAEA